jgi:hypothetical protein
VRWNDPPSRRSLDHAENPGAARFGVLQAFEHQRARAFRHHEAVAVLGERLGGAFRRVVGGRQRRQQRKRISARD